MVLVSFCGFHHRQVSLPWKVKPLENPAGGAALRVLPGLPSLSWADLRVPASFSRLRVLEDGDSIEQWSPAFLAPGTSFVEDNFSTDGGGRGQKVEFRW